MIYTGGLAQLLILLTYVHIGISEHYSGFGRRIGDWIVSFYPVEQKKTEREIPPSDSADHSMFSMQCIASGRRQAGQSISIVHQMRGNSVLILRGLLLRGAAGGVDKDFVRYARHGRRARKRQSRGRGEAKNASRRAFAHTMRAARGG